MDAFFTILISFLGCGFVLASTGGAGRTAQLAMRRALGRWSPGPDRYFEEPAGQEGPGASRFRR